MKVMKQDDYLKTLSNIPKEIIEEYNKLNKKAREAQDAYYNKQESIISDKEYDEIYDRIVEIEEQYPDIISSDSVTQTTGINAAGSDKVIHEEPALSCAKTKDRNELVKFIKDKEALLSWKCDGSTICITFDDGKLSLVATRGNGEVGENITDKGMILNCIPKTIPDKGHVILRGEFLSTYTSFNKFNVNGEYKHPRNFATGTLNQKDLNIVKQRQGELYIFDLIKCSNIDKLDTYEKQLQYCKKLGFNIVDYKKVNKDNVVQTVSWFENEIKKLDYPTDGLVLRFNDIAYGDSLGATGHHTNNMIAFKWADDVYETILRDIEWIASRTGRINPTAIFDPVDLDGAITSRCTLNNVSFIKDKKLGIGDRITVYRANMVIPTLHEDLDKSNNIKFPTVCPSCGEKLTTRNDGIAEFLICENPDCPAKNIRSLELFVSKEGLDIRGFSIKTVEALVDLDLLHNYLDIFDLPNHREELNKLTNFGEKTYNNLCEALDKCKDCEPHKVITALGIKNIGVGSSKDIVKLLDGDLTKLLDIDNNINKLRSIGNVASNSLQDYFNNKVNNDNFRKLLNILRVKKPVKANSSSLQGKVFVITGSLEHYNNRNELVKDIELNGGKVGSSVSKETNFLINNDIDSSSSKNKKAKLLGIPIINEKKIIEMMKDN